MHTHHLEFEVVVVGSGHAGSCAALSAAEHGCKRVLIVDKCPEEWAGGNGYFTAGAHRTVHGGLADLLPIVRNVPPELAPKIDVDPYTADQFTSDIFRMGEGRNDEGLTRAVVEGSREAVEWLARYVGVPFTLSFNRQAYEVDGRQKFWGGMALSTEDGGKGLIRAHREALKKAGVVSWFETRAVELIESGGKVVGLAVEKGGKKERIRARAIVLAAGGYEASAALREKHLGAGWVNARVRGTPYNTGDGIAMAAAAGAKLVGDWQGCHSTCWDANAPADTGDRVLSNQFTKSGYPLGIMVNARGQRFVDEGEDLRNYTYAKFGREVLHQPGGYAFQIWDSQVAGQLREEEYGDDVVEKIWADSIEDMTQKLGTKGLEDQDELGRTVEAYNAAVTEHRSENATLRWDPAVKDGLATAGLPLPKSNWALPLEEPPFLAVKVACGITFTFGGIQIDPETAGVVSEKTFNRIEGLFCTGEMVGGLWYGNYPGGSGLTAGAVFGRRAGREIAKMAGYTS